MGAAPGTAAAGPLEPKLFDDIDPVLLVRTQASADTTTLEAMKAKALATGQQMATEGAALLANQQEDILTADTSGQTAYPAITAPTPMPAPPATDTQSGGSGA